MKVLFVPSRRKDLSYDIDKREFAKFPKKLFLAYSLQYESLAKNVRKQLVANKIKVEGFRQVLGCSKINTKLPVLLISTGLFHAINLFLQAPKIFLLKGDKIIQVSQADIDKVRNRRRTALMKFLKAENIGILVSLKPGQESLKAAVSLKERLVRKGRKAYIFLADNIDIGQFENFPIDSWVNTACPGLVNDSLEVININELPKI